MTSTCRAFFRHEMINNVRMNDMFTFCGSAGCSSGNSSPHVRQDNGITLLEKSQAQSVWVRTFPSKTLTAQVVQHPFLHIRFLFTMGTSTSESSVAK